MMPSRPRPPLAPRAHRQPLPRGFTLIELLISMTIGIVLIGALGIIMARFERSKQQNATTMDLAQGTGYMAYDLDRQIRSAGSGMFLAQTQLFGCPLVAARNGTQILPRQSIFPKPFDALALGPRALPILVFPGQGQGGSDIIQIMTFAGGMSEAPQQIMPGGVTTNEVTLYNTVGYRGGDLVMLTEASSPCVIEQVQAGFVGSPVNARLQLGGAFYAQAIGSVANIVGMGVSGGANVIGLGNVDGNRPQLQLLGINDKQQLVAYDMLGMNNVPNSDVPLPVAENVMDMRVRYGVDTTAVGDGIVDAWVRPDTAPFNPATMNDNTNAAIAAMNDIVSIRLSLVVRGERIEKETDPRVSPPTLTMFGSLPANMQQTYTISDQERRRNYRLVELSIPIRNAILSAPGRVAPP